MLFIFNAQHDCRACRCSATGQEFVVQERLITDRTRVAVSHSATKRYLLNMHALHNADLIREALPRSLTKPKCYLTDRRARHNQIAGGLRITGTVRCAQAAAKAKQTRERNKEAREAAAGGHSAATGVTTMEDHGAGTC